MAYTLNKAEVISLGAELAELDDPRWAVVIATAQAVVANPAAFGGDANAKQCATYLAAHFAKLALVNGKAKPGSLPTGPLQGVTVGPVSKTFFQLGPTTRDEINAGLALTLYGVTFMQLRRTFSFARFTTT
jgi:hypothetical protein